MNNNDHNAPNLDQVNHEVDFDNSNIDFDADGLLDEFNDSSLDLDIPQNNKLDESSQATTIADDPYFNDLGTGGFEEFNLTDDAADFDEMDFNLEETGSNDNEQYNFDELSTQSASFDRSVNDNGNDNQGYSEINLDEPALFEEQSVLSEPITTDSQIADNPDAQDFHGGYQTDNSMDNINAVNPHLHDQSFEQIEEPPIAPATAATTYVTSQGVEEPTKNNKAAKLFGKKEPKAKKVEVKKSAKQSSPNLLKLLLALVILAILGLLAFLFLDNNQDEPVVAQPIPTPEVVADAPQTVDLAAAAEQAQPVTEMDTADTGIDDTNAIDVPTESGVVDITPPPKPNLTAAEILNADIPKDPALIKEEIDKLQQQEELYSEQEDLLQKQINDMEALTKDKAEHIALLEKQIAQLEAQKTQ